MAPAPVSFFLRGGLDVLRAFETMHERYPHVRLTLRTRLPELKPRFRRVLEKCWVRRDRPLFARRRNGRV